VSSICDFILDRISEEEFLADHMIRRHGARYLRAAVAATASGVHPGNPWNVMELCAERRRIVLSHADESDTGATVPGPLRVLAAAWSTHPDYRASWAPGFRLPRQQAGSLS